MEAVQLELPTEEAKPKSKYTFNDLPDGFLIQREGGISINVRYADTWMHLSSNDSIVGFGKHGLYGNDLMNAIGDYVTDLTWGRSGRYVKKANRAQSKDMISHALTTRLSAAMQRVRNEIAPPEVTDLAKKMWGSTQCDAKILHMPELYTAEYKHLRADLSKYHACRLYAKHCEVRCLEADMLFTASNWRKWLGVGSKDNRAINKSLDKFPRGVSFKDIDRVGDWQITQPITTRLHVIAMLAAVEHYRWELHHEIVKQATDAEIIQACEVIMQPVKKISKQPVIVSAMRRILDYDQRYGGDLVGLARRSLNWHTELMNRGDADYQRRYPLWAVDQPTSRPDVDLDALKELGITWLDTANAVVREGWLMEHCVASYAKKAVDGLCYLFHVEHAGLLATIEATPQGRVTQSYGPRDSKNAASEHGKREIDLAFIRFQASAIGRVLERAKA